MADGKATLVDCIEMASFANSDKFTILVPTAAGGTGTAIKIAMSSDSDGTNATDEDATVIGVGANGDTASNAGAKVIAAINGTSNASVNNGSTGASSNGVPGVTAAEGSTNHQITLTAANSGHAGNGIVTVDTAGGMMTAGTAKGGGTLVGTFVTVDEDLIASHYDRDGLTNILFGEAQVVSTGATTAGQYRYTASYEFPRTMTRKSGSDGGMGDPKEAYFGLQTGKSATDPTYDPGYADYLRRLPAGYAQTDTLAGPGTNREYSWVFSLDDVKTVVDGDIAKSAYFASGSRRVGGSLTAMSSSYKQILDEGYDRFTSPLYGGFDGWDIYEAEPIRNSAISSTDTQYTNYAYNTVKRAIDTCADPEFVETNLTSVPGLSEKNLTKHLIDTCEARADAMAVIDIENVYTPFTENTNSFQSNVGTVASAISSLRTRDLNSSYAATYYPWVQIRDPNTSKLVWAPPSVVALGTYASSEAKSELWFAPAGFTRGGLTDGAAGLPVVNTTERLVRSDRDKLYTANINPIASFPSEGIVVFGQKTLQVTPSALDRINVRRLMIYIKKEISRIAAGVLFDQNVKATWARFLAQANPFLGSVMSRLGLTEFKVVLDETTTTPDLIDRNILYAKIFLKPARSIEFIAIDFVISRTGASFED